MESLEHKIGYTFQDRSLLQESLTHSSYANERHGRDGAAAGRLSASRRSRITRP